MPLIPSLDPTLYSLTSAQIDLAYGLTVRGISDLTRDQEVKAEIELGSDGLPLGAPAGTFSGTIDFTVIVSEYAALLSALGPGYMQVSFPLNATYIEVSSGGVLTYEAPSIRITKDNWSEANDGKASRVKVSAMLLSPPLINGMPAIVSGSSGLVGSVTGIVGAVGAAFGGF